MPYDEYSGSVEKQRQGRKRSQVCTSLLGLQGTRAGFAKLSPVCRATAGKGMWMKALSEEWGDGGFG